MKRSIFAFALSLVLAVSATLAFIPSAWAAAPDDQVFQAVTADVEPIDFGLLAVDVFAAAPARTSIAEPDPGPAAAPLSLSRVRAFAGRIDARWSRDRWRIPQAPA